METVDFSLLSRVTRDIQDALIVLDTRGNILYSNPAASRHLGIKLERGTKYAAIMAAETDDRNDMFHQYLLDSVYDKQQSHGGELEYARPDGEKRVFHVLTSFLFGDDGTKKMGVVIQFSDITELSRTHKLHRNACYLFISILAALSFFVFFSMAWMYWGKPFRSSLITVLVELVGFGIVLLLYRSFDLTPENMGLRIRGCGKYILMDGIVTAVILGVMVLVKIYLRRAMILSPAEPFLHWEKWTIAKTFYPVTVVLQEFLTRSVIHEAIRQVLPAKNADLAAVAVSSLYFGAMHLHLGLAFMVGAALLLGVFGIIYCKQRCIWGLCIPHYFLGMALFILWGF